jgi:GTP cyclohydrolase IA
MTMDRARLEAAISEILRAIGEDPDRPELARTPERTADMFEELFGGLLLDPRDFLRDPLSVDHHELIALRDIAVRSMCEHHLVPMVGVAHLAYIPDGRIVGFDRLVRAIDACARRPQVQERLTQQIADLVDEMLEPQGVAVMLTLEQMCMTIRGVRETQSRTVTVVYRGIFESDPAWRAEFRAAVGAG